MRVIAILISALAMAWGASAGDLTKPHEGAKYEGAYYPGPYYSRAYLQDFPLQPGDRALLFRLRPFRHYGRYEYGEPIEPSLTDGTVDSYRFPYRYCWDFRPTPPAVPALYDACNDPRLRRYESANGGPVEVPAPNQPAEIPVPSEAPHEQPSQLTQPQ